MLGLLTEERKRSISFGANKARESVCYRDCDEMQTEIYLLVFWTFVRVWKQPM